MQRDIPNWSSAPNVCGGALPCACAGDGIPTKTARRLATWRRRPANGLFSSNTGGGVCSDPWQGLAVLRLGDRPAVGATGMGKSFLTHIVLARLMHHNKAPVQVFDMHNEYGYDDTASGPDLWVTGPKSRFASRIRVVGLGVGTTIRAATPEILSREVSLRRSGFSAPWQSRSRWVAGKRAGRNMPPRPTGGQ
jgi:hypothetical protein